MPELTISEVFARGNQGRVVTRLPRSQGVCTPFVTGVATGSKTFLGVESDMCLRVEELSGKALLHSSREETAWVSELD
jgi:hypothetical protein